MSLGQQVAQRSYLQYSRTQESSADQAALRFLDQSHMSAAGMRDFLQRLQDQELLPTDQQVEFVRTHPLTRERVESVTACVDAVTGSKPLPASYTQSFDRMRAKLEGFIDPRNALFASQGRCYRLSVPLRPRHCLPPNCQDTRAAFWR